MACRKQSIIQKWFVHTWIFQVSSTSSYSGRIIFVVLFSFFSFTKTTVLLWKSSQLVFFSHVSLLSSAAIYIHGDRQTLIHALFYFETSHECSVLPCHEAKQTVPDDYRWWPVIPPLPLVLPSFHRCHFLLLCRKR